MHAYTDVKYVLTHVKYFSTRSYQLSNVFLIQISNDCAAMLILLCNEGVLCFYLIFSETRTLDIEKCIIFSDTCNF